MGVFTKTSLSGCGGTCEGDLGRSAVGCVWFFVWALVFFWRQVALFFHWGLWSIWVGLFLLSVLLWFLIVFGWCSIRVHLIRRVCWCLVLWCCLFFRRWLSVYVRCDRRCRDGRWFWFVIFYGGRSSALWGDEYLVLFFEGEEIGELLLSMCGFEAMDGGVWYLWFIGFHDCDCGGLIIIIIDIDWNME